MIKADDARKIHAIPKFLLVSSYVLYCALCNWNIFNFGKKTQRKENDGVFYTYF